MSVDELHVFTVSHAGTSRSYSLPSSFTLGQLREVLQHDTQVPPGNQKLIVKGKTLSNDDATISSLFPVGVKMLLVGAKQASIAALTDEAASLQRRFEASSSRTTVKVRSIGINGNTVMDLKDIRNATGSAFMSIEVLKNCPHEDLRRQRLQKLSTDEAVLGEPARTMPVKPSMLIVAIDSSSGYTANCWLGALCRMHAYTRLARRPLDRATSASRPDPPRPEQVRGHTSGLNNR